MATPGLAAARILPRDEARKRWKEGDYAEHLSVVRHPGQALFDYLERSFGRLKREQARELAATQGTTG
jgi:hypothetical protein